MTEQIEDDFWAEERARAVAERGRQADPAACGTCRDRVAAGGQVEHDECAQRATLLPAPDAPGYELITGMTEEEVAKLPARFHIPVFMESSTPKAWVCAVCWGDGWSTLWPCRTAVDQGLRVFTADDYAETRAKKQAAELAAYRALELGDLDIRVSASCNIPDHPTWLRKPDDTRGCPWCRIAEFAAPTQDGVTAEQALITYAASARTVTADGLAPFLTAVKAEAMLAEWERLRPVREERNQLRAEVKQWRATYGRDALPGTRAQLEHFRKDRDAFRDQRNAVFQTNQRLIGEIEAADQARLHAENQVRKLTQANLDAAERAQKEIEQLRARVAELEALKPAPIQTCRKCGAGYTYGEPCSTCQFNALMAAEAGEGR